MKKIAIILLLFVGFACEKKDNIGEPLEIYHFIYLVNSDSVNIFHLSSMDSTNVQFDYPDRNIQMNWPEQKAFNESARNRLEDEDFGFRVNPNVSDSEKEFLLNFLDENPNFMVFNYRSGPSNVSIKNGEKVLQLYSFPREEIFDLNGTSLSSKTITTPNQRGLGMGINIVVIPNDLLGQ